MPNWQEIDALVKLVQFVGVKRSSYELNTPYDILTVDIPLIDVSSSMVRSWLGKNRTAKYIVPEAVHSYIEGEKLYGTK